MSSPGWLVLGERAVIRSSRNSASIIGAIVFPLLFFALFMLVMQRVMSSRGFDYRQQLPSAIVIQAMLFTAMSSTYYVADDRLSGIMARLRSLPLAGYAPLLGRSLADVARALVSITVVLIVGAIVGMRFEDGLIWLPAYIGVAVLFTMAMSLLLGLIAYMSPSVEGAVSIATIPYLPMIMLSSAFAPIEDFPDWLEPIVRWQPVTVTIDTLRALAGTGDVAEPLMASIAWSVGLILVAGALGARAVRRTT
ncbi:MAG: ABC transporter permease [Actinomycetota bacterium]